MEEIFEIEEEGGSGSGENIISNRTSITRVNSSQMSLTESNSNIPRYEEDDENRDQYNYSKTSAHSSTVTFPPPPPPRPPVPSVPTTTTTTTSTSSASNYTNLQISNEEEDDDFNEI